MKSLLLVLVMASAAMAQGNLPDIGRAPYPLFDSTRGAGGDTLLSKGTINSGGADLVGFFARYFAEDDSINVKVSAEFSPDGSLWFGSLGIDTAIVSGQADTSKMKRLDTFPDYSAFSRIRVVSLAATSDTVAVTIKLILHRLGMSRLH